MRLFSTPLRAAPLTLGVMAALTLVVASIAIPPSADAQIYVYPQRPTQSNVRYFDFDWLQTDILIGDDAQEPERQSRFRHRHRQDEILGHEHQGLTHGPRRLGLADYQASALHMGYGFFDDFDEASSEPPPPRRSDGDEDEEPELEDVFQPTTLDDKSGGVRLYFYEQERTIAERAAASIDETYRELVDTFRFVPSTTLPYILYNSYQEFLQTNIFPVQEGVLGVTGRQDLELVLPYFGDHRLFEHISRHEMVHQFQIQKAREVVREAELSGDPLDAMPLWFIEGMAEYYALGGIDDETEMLARDLLLNPSARDGFVILEFFEDRPFSQLWTYKIGQIRIAFLEETYGEATVQKLFEQSHQLVGRRADGAPTRSFRALLAELTGDDVDTLAKRFEGWLKERAYQSYLDAEQDAADFTFLNADQGIMQRLATSPDGHLLMHRSIQPNTGQVRLYLTDHRNRSNQERIAADGTPGVESLHPVGPRNFDLTNEELVFLARSRGHDVLYTKPIDHRAERRNDNWSIDLSTGSRQRYRLSDHDIIAAESPAYSPDGQRIAFVGLDTDGQKDIFIFQALEDDDFIVTRLTNQPQAPRGLSWGPDGIYYTSDATEHHYFNLFRIDPDDGPGHPERLTFEPRDHYEPLALDNGRVFLGAYHDTRANLYELTDEGLVRRTDVVTGLFDVAAGPADGLWANYQFRGRRQPVSITADTLLDDDPIAQDDSDAGVPQPYPTQGLDDATDYEALSLTNWQLSSLFGVLGASSSGIFGQISMLTNDRLRNHAIFLNVLAFGDLDNTVFDLLYLNQESRLIWGTGLFQDVRYRIDQTFDDVEDMPRFLSGERFYGARGSLRYPFDRFSFLQGDLAIGGTSYFLRQGAINTLDQESEARADIDFVDQWEQRFDEHRFQVSPSLSLGYNTIRLHPGTGPIDGSSALLSTRLDLQPFDDEAHGSVRFDAERYFPIYDRMNLSFRTGLGSTFGGALSQQFFLSSFDTLRGVEFGDLDYLLGDQFFFTKLELRFPLNFLVRVPVFDIEGIVGADFGGAGQGLRDLWEWRAFSPVTGLNFGLGPLVFRLHFAKPVDIGAPQLPRDGDWITNFSLGWRYW